MWSNFSNEARNVNADEREEKENGAGKRDMHLQRRMDEGRGVNREDIQLLGGDCCTSQDRWLVLGEEEDVVDKPIGR